MLQACQNEARSQPTQSESPEGSFLNPDSIDWGMDSLTDAATTPPNATIHSDAAKVFQEDSKHIVLHAENCALMCATVHGGKADRGKFGEALTSVLCNPNRKAKISIHDLFTQSSGKTNQYQIPEFRSTLRKPLLL